MIASTVSIDYSGTDTKKKTFKNNTSYEVSRWLDDCGWRGNGRGDGPQNTTKIVSRCAATFAKTMPVVARVCDGFIV